MKRSPEDAKSETAIDLSLHPRLHASDEGTQNNTVLRPVPRPAWSILWYQSMWSLYTERKIIDHPLKPVPTTSANAGFDRKFNCAKQDECNGTHSAPLIPATPASSEEESAEQDFTVPHATKNKSCNEDLQKPGAAILDFACCDGPVQFERISNPNFALTVEHNSHETGQMQVFGSPEPKRNHTMKTYLCIYCNQSFKSLFCYQKHKKRHLNPVSVDITATNSAKSLGHTENIAVTKDLNVQFFPCKKCGSKFPSYYFVHKHKKNCH